jgi:ectoine hydroxylase-related dioxygenase (phytanoyl-CoA dioxygenase family)
MTSMFDPQAFREAIDRDGCAVLPGLLEPEFIVRARRALEQAIDQEVAYHGSSEYPDYGMVLLCSLYGGAFLELFDNERVLAPFEVVLGEGCIVYAYTSSSMPPARQNYSTRVHTDSRRIISGYLTNVGLTLLLDDFTADNGATWYLAGSHRRPDAPSDEEFFANARRLIAPAGSGLFFDANLWHSGGLNHTAAWRHALTINMCRAWMKQRIDIPRAMRDRGHPMSERAAQKLGFHAQVPASYDEYYLPPERRKFRQKPD